MSESQEFELPMKPGVDIVIELAGVGRSKFQLIGFLQPKYLIVKPPQKLISTAAINFKSGTILVARYVNEGRVFAFKSKVICLTTQPDKLVYVEYPKEFDEYNARSCPRYNPLIPARLIYQDTEYSGILTDISISGFCFRTTEFDSDINKTINKAKVSKVFIQFPGVSGEKEFNCFLRNHVNDRDQSRIGSEFSELDDNEKDIITNFLNVQPGD